MTKRKASKLALLPSGAIAVIIRIVKDVALVRRETDKETFRIRTKYLKPLTEPPP